MEKPVSWWELKRLVSLFEARDLTLRVIMNPERYELGRTNKLLVRLIRRLPISCLRVLLPLSPGWIFLLRKAR